MFVDTLTKEEADLLARGVSDKDINKKKSNATIIKIDEIIASPDLYHPKNKNKKKKNKDKKKFTSSHVISTSRTRNNSPSSAIDVHNTNISQSGKKSETEISVLHIKKNSMNLSIPE